MEYLREKSALERGQTIYMYVYITIADAVIDGIVYGNWMFRLSTLYYLSGNGNRAKRRSWTQQVLRVNILN